MRLLWTANLPWCPAHGGGNKVNRALCEGLAALGHEVRAVVPLTGPGSHAAPDEVRARLEALGARIERDATCERATLNGVELRLVASPELLRDRLVEELRCWRPDRVVVTSEDLSQRLLAAALAEAGERVVYLVLTTSFLPFGPQSFCPGERRAQLVARVRSVVVMSEYLAAYLRDHAGLPSTVLHMPLYGEPALPEPRARPSAITMVNPCVIKGLPIFVELARRLPQLPFRAVPTWGARAADLALLRSLPNVTMVEPDEDIGRVLAGTRVLLMPSLWQEAFGLTCIEAMLCGIPVVASAVGGLVEAKLGTDYLLPVRSIESFGSTLDERMLAEATVPAQDLSPWQAALERLTSDETEYAAQSEAARAAAARYRATATPQRFAHYLEALA